MSAKHPARFAGKSVLVTGASQGIGEGIAIAFAEEGARVAVNGRKEDALKKVLGDLPDVEGGHLVAQGDMAAEADVDRVMKTTIETFDGLDVLVCNAGIMIPSASEDVTLDDFNKVIAVNLTSVVLCARAALKYWRANDKIGTIIVNSSVHQQIPKPNYLGYSASKGAVGNVVRTLALEYARYGIRVNAVAPGAIVTPMNDAWVHDKKQYDAVAKHIPMRRPGESREIADAVTFFASNEASYITGQTLFVDGGLTLYGDFEQNWSS